MQRLRRNSLHAAGAALPSCALHQQLVPRTAVAQRDLSHVAPADRYFGRLKLSYITIDNTFQHAAIQAGAHTTDSGIANKVDFAMKALNDWRRSLENRALQLLAAQTVVAAFRAQP